MKKIAIIVSLFLVGLVTTLVFMPHSSPVEHVVAPIVDTNTETTVKPVITETPIPKPITKPKTNSPAPVSPTPAPQYTPPPVVPPEPVDTTKYYSSAEVAAHGNTQSCWSIINGKVYDLTSWISEHPGGSGSIKRLCGVDGSEDFNDQHGGESRPERELAAFFIGVYR